MAYTIDTIQNPNTGVDYQFYNISGIGYIPVDFLTSIDVDFLKKADASGDYTTYTLPNKRTAFEFFSSLAVIPADYFTTIQDQTDENAGNVSVTQDTSDAEGKSVMNTIFGEQTVAERSDSFNIAFQYNLSSRDVEFGNTGTGVAQHAGLARAEVRTGTGIGSAYIQSLDAIRYVAGKEMVAHFTTDFNGSEVNVNQYHGVMDTDNGFGVGYKDTEFGMWFRRGGVDAFTPFANFNRKPDNFTFDPTGFHIYKISYGWLGIAPAIISVYSGGWIPLHSIDYTGQEEPHLLNPVLPIRFEIERTSGTGADIVMRTSSWRGGIVGKQVGGTGADRTFETFVESKSITASTETPIITLKNKTVFNGINNHVSVRYGTVSLAVEGTKPVKFKVYRNGTLTGAIFADVDTNESVTQVDTTATAISGAGSPIGGTLVGKTGSVRINLFESDVRIAIRPDETVTLTAFSDGSTTVDAIVRHIEEF